MRGVEQSTARLRYATNCHAKMSVQDGRTCSFLAHQRRHLVARITLLLLLSHHCHRAPYQPHIHTYATSHVLSHFAQGATLPVVDSHAIEDVVSAWTGIPAERMGEDEKERLRELVGFDL